MDVFIGLCLITSKGLTKLLQHLKVDAVGYRGYIHESVGKNIVGIFKLVCKHNLDGWINTIYILVYIGTFDLSKYG